MAISMVIFSGEPSGLRDRKDRMGELPPPFYNSIEEYQMSKKKQKHKNKQKKLIKRKEAKYGREKTVD